MRAVVFRNAGPPSVLELPASWPEPQIQYGQVKVKIFATSVNPIDYKLCFYTNQLNPEDPCQIPGADLAGVVTESSAERSRFSPGDRVFGMADTYAPWSQAGTYAEYICVNDDQLARMPDSMSYEDAAALPLGDADCMAGSGGVGTMAIQIAKLWGAHVVTTCSAAKFSFVQSLGADECVDYTKDKFEDLYAHHHFDVVLDLVGGPYEARSKMVLKKSGHYAHVMNQGWVSKVGVYADTPVELLCILKGKLWQTIGWGPKYGTKFVQPSSTQLEIIGRLVAEGKLQPVIYKVLPLEHAQQAHAYMEEGHAKGKVVLTVAS